VAGKSPVAAPLGPRPEYRLQAQSSEAILVIRHSPPPAVSDRPWARSRSTASPDPAWPSALGAARPDTEQRVQAPSGGQQSRRTCSASLTPPPADPVPRERDGVPVAGVRHPLRPAPRMPRLRRDAVPPRRLTCRDPGRRHDPPRGPVHRLLQIQLAERPVAIRPRSRRFRQPMAPAAAYSTLCPVRADQRATRSHIDLGHHVKHRIAAERDSGTGFTIDDVADGMVALL
jgi:hypothetical protein